ncbi:unnamed protein product [Ilex paraguariensis]|uniref:Uncharacterized protein n=1 Tax=Ilex paraguariensis TaxID=185542 RepID=A0ABC8UJW5_9AQUA
MAEYVAVRSHIKLHPPLNCIKIRVPAKFNTELQRKCYSGDCIATLLSPLKIHKIAALRVTSISLSPSHKESILSCNCTGTLIDLDGATSSDWVPVVDQVLLMASMFLTYIAGVIPVENSHLKSPKSISNDYMVPEDASFLGSDLKSDERTNLELIWDVVKGKLVDSISAVQHKGYLVNKATEVEQHQAKIPLSLYAVAEGPRFRLLWASFQWLKKEVDGISENCAPVSTDDWLMVFSEIILKSCQPVCMAWLEEELFLKNRKPDKALLSSMDEKLNGYYTILQNIRKSGKEDLYAALISVLRFGSLRNDSCYDYSLFTMHGVSILEDLVIKLADGIASMYLELISVDGSMSNEINNIGSSLCTLSTRALQKLRNEVVLNQWLHQNIEAVVSMYEDRFDLCTLQIQLIEQPSKSEAGKIGWWKKLSLRRYGPLLSPLRYAVVSYISIPVKRTNELRALSGWRYYFSLLLELADITMPLVRTVCAKISDAISFFLVCLIGRSLGLIFTGIRQSLRWK